MTLKCVEPLLLCLEEKNAKIFSSLEPGHRYELFHYAVLRKRAENYKHPDGHKLLGFNPQSYFPLTQIAFRLWLDLKSYTLHI